MLLYIDNTFVTEIQKNNKTAIEALNLIALGRKQGNHLLLAERSNLKVIRDCEYVSEDTKRVFTFLYENFPNFAIIKSKLTFYIKIISGTKHMSLVKSDLQHICEISYDYFQDLKIITETVVIGENQSEIEFYKYIANHCKQNRDLSSLPLKCQSRMGGGNTTHTVYSNEQDQEQSFCLCYVDSDKKYPNAQVGDTLKAVRKADNPCKLLSKLYELKVREIENIIPINILEKVIDLDINHKNGLLTLKKVLKSENYKDLFFLDFKNGISIKNYKKINDVNLIKFINTLCINSGLHTKQQLDDFKHIEDENYFPTRVVIQGLGSNILDRVIKFINQNKTLIPNFDFNEQKDEWFSVGDNFINWTCSGHRII